MYKQIITELKALRDQMADYQIPLIDNLAPPEIGAKAKRRQISKTLSKLRALHEELNFQLYSHPTERPVVHSPADCYEVLNPFLAYLDHEELWVINLDTRNRIMNLVKLYQGSVNSSQVRISEVFRQAIMDNSPAILIAHNHPSGDPAPSPDDIAVTRSIFQAGKLLDIDVLDHLVVGRGRYVSLKERGLGFGV
jgi:DNA repair protein RadC